MSELSAIRSQLSAIAASQARTEEAIGWIKDGMEDCTQRMDDHEKRLRSQERRSHWYAGFAAAIGMAAGALGWGTLPKP